MKKFLSLFGILALLQIVFVSALGIGCSGNNPTSSQQASVFGVVKNDTALKTMAAVMSDPQLESSIAPYGPYTIFAPVNFAFTKLNYGTLAEIQNNPSFKRGVLMNHIVKGRFTFAQLTALDSVQSMSDRWIHFRTNKDTLIVNDSIRVVEKDIDAANGVVHCIDGVIVR